MSDSSGQNFAALGLSEKLVQTVVALGYEAPTPIQERTIPVLLSGRDLIGQAQTGTGKTAAFALPILQKLDLGKSVTQALVLAPTRELAMQVAEAFHSYAAGMAVSVLPVYGGAPIFHQLKRLERGVQVVVGTPGRLIDHLDRKTLKLEDVSMIVLDEADEMLKMGFIDDVERILSEAGTPRQVALFSATMPAEVLRIAKRHLNNPERVELEHKSVAAPAIEQRFLNVSEAQKLEVLTQVLELEDHPAVLIFRRTKNGAAELTERLEGRGFAAEAMHGDMNQPQRESVIRRVKAGQIEIVVATDVAARGLDVEQISHVINYDIPNDVEAYVHRIGRTGRAGRSGVATLFVTPRERRMMRDIERFTGSAIKPMKMPTRADIAAKRVGQLKDSIRKDVERGDLDLYLALVEQLVEEGRHDMAEIAAAAARLASIARPIDDTSVGRAAEEEEEQPAPRPRAAASSRAPRGDSDAGAPRPAVRRTARVPDEGPRVRLSMSVGKREGIRPADVVGSIANEANIPGHEIGPIDIREEVTYVTIPAEAVDNVIAKVSGRRFRGKALNLHVANESEGMDSRGRGEERAPRAERPYRSTREESSPRPAPRYGATRADRSAPSRDARPAGLRSRTERPERAAPARDPRTGGFRSRDNERPERPFRPGSARPAPRRDAAPAGSRFGSRDDRGPSSRPAPGGFRKRPTGGSGPKGKGRGR